MVNDGWTTGGDGQARLLAPPTQRACAPLVLRIVGLPARAPVHVASSTQDRSGRLWRAEAVFRSPDTVVDVARDASSRGTYLGVHPDGLLTTMRPARDRALPRRRFVPASPDRFLVHLEVRVAGEVVATAAIARVLVDPAVTVRPLVVGGNTLGTVWQPPAGLRRRPPILVVAPRGSSMARHAPGLLASRGYPTVGVALPTRSRASVGPPAWRRRAVDRVHEALAAVAAQPGIDGRGVVLIGVAEGAESVVQAAADRTDLGAVVAYLAPHGRGLGWLLHLATVRAAGGRRRRPLDPIDARLLVVGAEPDRAAAPATWVAGSGRILHGAERWVATTGTPPLGPGRLPGDAVGDPRGSTGGEAWDLVLDLLRDLSVTHGLPPTDAGTAPVSPTRRGRPGPGRSAR